MGSDRMSVIERKGSTANVIQRQKEEQEAYSEQTRLRNDKTTFFLDQTKYQVLTVAVALLNMATIGMETDFEVSNEGTIVLFQLINSCFLLAYLTELAVRFLFLGKAALRDTLTIIDLIVVILGFLERVVTSGRLARALPTFKLVRFFRIFRGAKLAMVSPTLLALAQGAPSLIRALCWLGLMICVVLFACAAFAKTIIGESAAWGETQDPLDYWEPFEAFDNRKYFGGCMRSFLSLWQVVTQSQWADEFARPVLRVYPSLFFFFYFLSFSTSYGLLLGVLCVSVVEATNSAKVRKKVDDEFRQLERERISTRCMELLQVVDLNNDGELTAKELEDALDLYEFRQLLIELNVPVLDGENLVLMLDRNGDGFITYDEFKESVLDMDKPILSRDWSLLRIWLEAIEGLTRDFDRRVNLIETEIATIKRDLKNAIDAIELWTELRKFPALYQKALEKVRNAKPEMPPKPDNFKLPVKELPVSNQARVLEYFRQNFAFPPCISIASPPLSQPVLMLPNAVPSESEIHDDSKVQPSRHGPSLQVHERRPRAAAVVAAKARFAVPPPIRRRRGQMLGDPPPGYTEESIARNKRTAEWIDKDMFESLHPFRPNEKLTSIKSQLRSANAVSLALATKETVASTTETAPSEWLS
eukprot:TRINITY_DN73741_c0_g1_i1.p1 TRINITY_DN73741_c0_g1~~TRINITY_DN73741_c0_g1_i1.p1  ORF type:complete len:645 (+),score=116.12 TRINITY_DN73741_c0_g1_i1:415-2349(+)